MRNSGKQLALTLGLAAILTTPSHGQPDAIQFVFTSDAHYGLTRLEFQGRTNVEAHAVNMALVAKMNTVGREAFPADGGLRSGEQVGAIDFVVEGGDVANRAEIASGIQSAAASWSQFSLDYRDGLALVDRTGHRAPLYVVPGNHDASNAVGFYKPLSPTIDQTAMIAIYNLMMAPAAPKTPATFNYQTDRVRCSRDVGGVHFVFLPIWPDSPTRAWLEQDLARVSASAPVVIFTHDAPEAPSKHFINPNAVHDINAVDKFENLLADTFADGDTVSLPAVIEQRAFEAFLKRHANVSAYFHGDSNWNQFYDWTGPDHTVGLHTFRVDSPLKGAVSSKDETKLSFQVVTIDMASRTMTVRECLWNLDPRRPAAAIGWGASTTVALCPLSE